MVRHEQVVNCSSIVFPPAAQPVTLAGLASTTLVFDVFLTSDAGGASLTCAVGVLDSQVATPEICTS